MTTTMTTSTISKCTSSVLLLLLLSVAPVLTGGETCYSRRSGFLDCWNGCCGPEDDQTCCSTTVLVLGLALGGAVVLLVVVLVVVCFACKDCRPKACCRRRRGRGRGRRGHGGAHVGGGGRHRLTVVHPVGPPDYITATQLRAPSVQPGFYRRNVPSSPPPPYTDSAHLTSQPPTVSSGLSVIAAPVICINVAPASEREAGPAVDGAAAQPSPAARINVTSGHRQQRTDLVLQTPREEGTSGGFPRTGDCGQVTARAEPQGGPSPQNQSSQKAPAASRRSHPHVASSQTRNSPVRFNQNQLTENSPRVADTVHVIVHREASSTQDTPEHEDRDHLYLI